jgi:hypothetical protein
VIDVKSTVADSVAVSASAETKAAPPEDERSDPG